MHTSGHVVSATTHYRMKRPRLACWVLTVGLQTEASHQCMGRDGSYPTIRARRASARHQSPAAPSAQQRVSLSVIAEHGAKPWCRLHRRNRCRSPYCHSNLLT